MNQNYDAKKEEFNRAVACFWKEMKFLMTQKKDLSKISKRKWGHLFVMS